MTTVYKRSVTQLADLPKLRRALAVLGATNVKLEAYGWWRCTDGEGMDLWTGAPVLAVRGSRIKVHVSAPEGMVDVWAAPDPSEDGTRGGSIVLSCSLP